MIVSIIVAVPLAVGIGYALAPDPAADASLSRSAGQSDPSIGVNASLVGKPLPMVTIETASGETTTADLLGTPLVINYWYSACAPCKKELPDFAAVDAELGDAVRFVGINPFDNDRGEAFAAARGVSYELFGDSRGLFADAVGIVVSPVTLFVDADGIVVAQRGVVDQTDLRSIITTEFGL